MIKLRVINVFILIAIVLSYFINEYYFVIKPYNDVTILLAVALIALSIIELTKIRRFSNDVKFKFYPYRLSFVFQKGKTVLLLSLAIGVNSLFFEGFYLAGFLILYSFLYRISERIIRYRKGYYNLQMSATHLIINEDESFLIELNRIDRIVPLDNQFKFSMKEGPNDFTIKLNKINKSFQDELKKQILELDSSSR